MNEINESNDVKKETSSEFNETVDNNYENYVNCNAEKHIENSENDVNKDEISSELSKEIDDVYNRYITDSVDNKEDVDFKSDNSYNDSGEKSELPDCFSNLSDDAKNKQIEALNKMSDDEKNSYFAIIEKEPKITEGVKNVAENNGAELAGLEYRVKTPSSTYEKMHERTKEKDLDDMDDVIRYTEIYSPDELAEGTNDSLKEFESKGYKIDSVRNTWDKEGATYRGINAKLTSPDGQKFEMQFHTKESFELKNGELHSLYEKSRTMSVDNPKAIEINDKMSELSAKLERPKNIDEVKNR